MSERDLLSVAEAITVIDAVTVHPRVRRIRLIDAQGFRLAQDIRADRDYPPFDKSLMDGYAVRCADVKTTPVDLQVIGEIAAGQRPERPIGPGQTMAIMTGAPLPEGADGVVPVEEVERKDEGGRMKDEECKSPDSSFILHPSSFPLVRVLSADNPSRFVAPRGADCAAGTVVLNRGTKLEAAQLAVAASFGAAEVDVFDRPRVAVLSTGDELVSIDSTPGPAQIRNSNNIMLAALLRRLGCDVTDLGMVRDDPDAIRADLQRGIVFDALFISGGMSMGQYDFVPGILVELGVELKITKLRIKPGKPFVFGTMAGARGKGQGASEEEIVASLAPGPSSLAPSSFVFGLPGNPVSSFVCALRLCSRLLARMSGAETMEKWTEARLELPLDKNGDREFHQPAILNGSMVRPLQWKGSADIYTLAAANALLVRPENAPAAPAGATVNVLEIPS